MKTAEDQNAKATVALWLDRIKTGDDPAAMRELTDLAVRELQAFRKRHWSEGDR